MITDKQVRKARKNIHKLIKYQETDDPKSMIYYYRGRELDQSMGGISSVYFQDYYNTEEIAALGLPKDRKYAIEVLLNICQDPDGDLVDFSYDLLRKDFSEKEDLPLIEEFIYHPNKKIGYYALSLLEIIYGVKYLTEGLEYLKLIEKHMKLLTDIKLKDSALFGLNRMLKRVKFKDFKWKEEGYEILQRLYRNILLQETNEDLLTDSIAYISNFAGHINLEEFFPLIERAKKRIHKEENRQHVEKIVVKMKKIQVSITERKKHQRQAEMRK